MASRLTTANKSPGDRQAGAYLKIDRTFKESGVLSFERNNKIFHLRGLIPFIISETVIHIYTRKRSSPLDGHSPIAEILIVTWSSSCFGEVIFIF